MIEVSSLVALLEGQGVRLWVEQGRVRYVAPAGVMTEELMAGLRERKAQIVGLLTQRGAAALARSTLQQEWLWWSLLRYENWNHLLYAYALRVVGDFDTELFGRCLTELTRRHRILRSKLVVQERELHQLVSPPRESWPRQCAPAKDARLLVETFFDRITDPDAAGLFEVKIFRLANREHVVALAIHHIISDARSISLMFRELWSLYAGIAVPPSIPAQYTDYAQWQRRVWRHESYWDKCLHQAPRLRLHDTASDAACKELAVVIEAPLAAQVREFAREKRSLVAITMFAAYAALVARWCGTRDLLLPFATSGRHLPEHDGMIGFFSYYLYVRIHLETSDSFRTLLDTVTRGCYQVLGHQDFARGLEREPQLVGNPSFNWISVSEEETSGLPPLDVRVRLGDAFTVAPFEFQRTLQRGVVQHQSYAGIILWDAGTTFRGKFYLCPGDAPIAERFLDDYGKLLQEVINDADQRLFVAQ